MPVATIRWSRSAHARRPSQNDQMEHPGDSIQGDAAIPPRRQGRTRRIIAITAAALGAVLVASLIAADIIGSAIGCGSVDPTDPSNYSTATIVNDMANPIRIGGCRGTYCGPQPSANLAPNQHASINGACGVSGADMTSWEITGSGGRLIGYIAINSPRSRHDLMFNASKASPNRLTPTKPN